MALTIKNKYDLSLTKKDTISLTLSISGVDFVAGDIVTFIVKKLIDSSTATIEKVITTFVAGDAVIELTSDDTNIDKGLYYWGLRWEEADGTEREILPSIACTKAEFRICDGVTT